LPQTVELVQYIIDWEVCDEVICIFLLSFGVCRGVKGERRGFREGVVNFANEWVRGERMA
jgi:hypothetical protein